MDGAAPKEGGVAAQADGIPLADHPAARLRQDRCHGGDVPGVHSGHRHFASGRRSRRQICTGHDPVPHDGIFPAVQGPAALDHHHGGPRAPHTGAHGREEALEIHDLRFPGRIAQNSGPGRRHRRQHGVLGGPYAGTGKDHFPALQRTPAVQASAPLLDLSPQGTNGLEVQVDGTGSQLTPARKGEVGLPHPSQDGPQEDHGGAHLPHQGVGNVPAYRGRGVHRHGGPLLGDPAAQMAQDLQRGRHIGQGRAVMDHTGPRRQNGGSQDGKGAVLRPMDADCAAQRPSAFNDQSTHGFRPPQHWFVGFTNHPMQSGTIGEKPYFRVRARRVL